MTFGERVRIKRKEIGMTQLELAERLGYKDRSSVARIESGERDVPRPTIIALANALGVTPAYLMVWEDEKSAPTVEDGRSKEKEIEKMLRNLSDSELDKVSEFIAFLLSQRKGEK